MFLALMVIGYVVPGPLVDGVSAVFEGRVPFAAWSAVDSQVAAGATVVRASGVGYPPPRMRGVRGRLMARRAAEVVAVRNLATKLGYTRRATIRGFRYASTAYRADGSVEVVVEYPASWRANSQ